MYQLGSRDRSGHRVRLTQRLLPGIVLYVNR